MKTKNVLAVYLKQKRLAASLSQGDVAKKLGYSTPQFISNWERGVSAPPVQALKKIAGLYQVPAEELFDVVLNHTVNIVTADLRRKFSNSVTPRQMKFQASEIRNVGMALQ